ELYLFMYSTPFVCMSASCISTIPRVYRTLGQWLSPRYIVKTTRRIEFSLVNTRSTRSGRHAFFVDTTRKLGRFVSQSVKLTSNDCTPIEEAKPSVWPARYMATPFPFVILACIFPSISVSPRLTPRYLPE